MPAPLDRRLASSLEYLRLASDIFNRVADAQGSSVAEALGRAVASLVVAAQGIRRRREQCAELLAQVEGIIGCIVAVHIPGQDASKWQPIAGSVERFTETLHKLYAYLSTQQSTHPVRQLFRQNEINQLLKDCHAGLAHVKTLFQLETTVQTVTDLEQLRQLAAQQHQNLLQGLDGSSDTHSSAGTWRQGISNASEDSFLLLPPAPQIFYGRESELQNIIHLILQDAPARIAILGSGGIGKTTLAKAVLHDPEVIRTTTQRIFVPCRTARDACELAVLVGSSIGIQPSKDITRTVLRRLSSGDSSKTLLVLDNIDDAWETRESQAAVEKFLSQLSGIDNLILLVTLRGTERPSSVKWTRPFLPALSPVSRDAALTILQEISDVPETPALLQVLALTDHVPLAIELMAHALEFEEACDILGRWEKERTDVLRNGADGGNALEISIGVSLSSPRLADDPGAWKLLQLLSLLPDGLSDGDLLSANLPIPEILRAKSTLTRVSLAYASRDRVKVLTPVRDFVRLRHLPSPDLCLPMLRHFTPALEEYHGFKPPLKSSVASLRANAHNIRELLLWSQNGDLSAGEVSEKSPFAYDGLQVYTVLRRNISTSKPKWSGC